MKNEKGVVRLFFLLVLLVGVVLGVYLSLRPQIYRPKATTDDLAEQSLANARDLIYVKDRIILEFNDDITEKAYIDLKELVSQAIGGREIEITKMFDTDNLKLKNFYILSLPKNINSDASLTLLKKSANIRSADYDISLKLRAMPNDTYFNEQELNYKRVAVDQTWDMGPFTVPVKIGVIDTGVDTNHPDFEGSAFEVGFNFEANNYDTADFDSHGTEVAGIINAMGNNARGIVGVGWKSRFVLIPYKISQANSAFVSSVAQAIFKAASEDKVSVVNLSVGTIDVNCQSDITSVKALSNATKVASEEYNLILIAAAGNDDSDFNGIPNSCQGVMSVGAINGRTGQAYQRSNWGEWVKISAPGEKILTLMSTTCRERECVFRRYSESEYYAFSSGTSFASPFVAAGAAILKSSNPGLTANQVKQCLITNADHQTQTGKEIGPILDIKKALDNIGTCQTLPR